MSEPVGYWPRPRSRISRHTTGRATCASSRTPSSAHLVLASTSVLSPEDFAFLEQAPRTRPAPRAPVSRG